MLWPGRPPGLGVGQDFYKNRLTSASYPVAEDTVWMVPGERAVRGLYRRWREGKTRAGSAASSALSE